MTLQLTARGPLRSGTPLAACDEPNVVVETVKPAEDGCGFILRLYDDERHRGPVTLTFSLPMAHVTLTDIRQSDPADLPVDKDRVIFDLAPFEIVTLRRVPGVGGGLTMAALTAGPNGCRIDRRPVGHRPVGPKDDPSAPT